MTTPTPKNPLNAKSLLGVAFAGITCMTQQAEAASVFTEVIDFGNSLNVATDLSAEFTDFSAAGGIMGHITLDNSGLDFYDYFVIRMAASTSVSIPFTCISSTGGGVFGFNAFASAGVKVGDGYVYPTTAGISYAGVLSFVVPASGKVILGTNSEAGNTTLNYTLGVVPEPSTGLISLAAVAAAALRRRREAL